MAGKFRVRRIGKTTEDAQTIGGKRCRTQSQFFGSGKFPDVMKFVAVGAAGGRSMRFLFPSAFEGGAERAVERRLPIVTGLDDG